MYHKNTSDCATFTNTICSAKAVEDRMAMAVKQTEPHVFSDNNIINVFFLSSS